MNDLYDLIIIGTGPAGLTAGIYSSVCNRYLQIGVNLKLGGIRWGIKTLNAKKVDYLVAFPMKLIYRERVDIITKLYKTTRR